MPKYCPNCGHQVDAGALFCDNCGTKLQERPNTQPEPQPQQPPVRQQPVQPQQQPAAQAVRPVQQPVQQPVQPPQQPDRRAPMPPMPPAQQPGRQMPPPPPAGGQYGYPAPQPPKKKKSGVAVVIVIVVALLMVLTAVIGFIAYRAYKRYVVDPDASVSETTSVEPATIPKTSETPETSTEPPVTAPRFDDVERPVASDFAWIADGDGVFESGPYLDSAAILGKWKCEIVYNGIWELCVVTIDADGSVEFEPLEINYGEGWEDEEGEEHYYFEGEVTEGSASGSGKYGSINLFEFVEIEGIQYGKGMFHVNDYGSCDVYLVRP